MTMSRTRLRNSAATDSARTRSEISKKLTPKVYESAMGPTTCKRRITRSCTKSLLHMESKMADMESPAAEAAVAVTPTKNSPVAGGGDMAEVEKGTPENCSPCATPKAEKFRIPEINTCPPAPKKRRVLDYSSKSVRRRPIAFFTPPDVEMFFFAALRDIPAA